MAVNDVNFLALPSPGAVPAAPNFATSVSAAGAAVMAKVAKGRVVVGIAHSCGAGIGCES